MIRGMTQVFKSRLNTVMTLGWAYGATIVFTFFGPALMRNSGDASVLSLLAVLSHVLAFFFRPFRLERESWYFPVFFVALLPLVLSFPSQSFPLQAVTVTGYAWMIGRIGSFWTLRVFHTVDVEFRGRTICSALFVAFVLIYLVNLGQHLLSGLALMAVAASASGLAVYFYGRMEPPLNPCRAARPGRAQGHLACFGFLMTVYIAGGFSYAGIYPSFMAYAGFDRYYNVLGFLVGLTAAGSVLDRLGRKIAFSIGVAFLGISFTFFVMPSSLVTYFFSQTFLQAGWAFVNAFGWSFSWDMADRSKQRIVFSRGIASMLLGTALGGLLYEVSAGLGISHEPVYGMLSLVPLFLSVAWLVLLPETLEQRRVADRVRLSDLEVLPLASELTRREKQVLCLMLDNMNNAEIGGKLFISQSTVKTHVSRIYSKLGINPKRAKLFEYVDNYLKLNKNISGPTAS